LVDQTNQRGALISFSVTKASFHIAAVAFGDILPLTVIPALGEHAVNSSGFVSASRFPNQRAPTSSPSGDFSPPPTVSTICSTTL
jgi:hypothetical protein